MSSVPKSLGVIPPFILQYDPSNAPVMQVAVYGGGSQRPQLYDYARNNIEPLLEGIPGVASASPNGGRERQINVIVDPAKAQARGLTSSDVAQPSRNRTRCFPRVASSAQFSANVYTNAVPQAVADIGDAVVKLARRQARAHQGRRAHRGRRYRRRRRPSRSTARTRVYLNVLRVPGGNVVEIIDEVKKTVANLKDLPPGVQVDPVFDQSTFVRTTYRRSREGDLPGARPHRRSSSCSFSRAPRSVLIAAIAVPFSFAIILIVLYATGQTLNAFTLGGLTLAMGPLVDISVVVLESVHRHQRMLGQESASRPRSTARTPSPSRRSRRRSRRSRCSCRSLLLAGLAKKLFVPLALTVATAMFAGYFVSMTSRPWRAATSSSRASTGGLRKRSRRSSIASPRLRARCCGACSVPAWVLGAAVVLVAGERLGGGAAAEHVLPRDRRVDGARLRALHAGHVARGCVAQDRTRWARRSRRAAAGERQARAHERRRAEQGAKRDDEPEHGHPHGFIRVALADAEKRRLITARARRSYARDSRAQLPGRRLSCSRPVVSSRASSRTATSRRSSSRSGATTSTRCSSKSKAVAEVARTVPGIRDIYTFAGERFPEVRVETDRETAGLVGVTCADAAQTTLEATLGNVNTPASGSTEQRPVVLRRDLLRRRVGHRHQRARADPRPRRRRRRGGHARRLRENPRSVGPVAISAINSPAPPTSHADRGTRHRKRRGGAREEARDGSADEGT